MYPNAGLPWSDEDDCTVIDMKVRGCSAAEIAEAVGRPLPALSYRVSKVLRERIKQARARDAQSKPKPAPAPTPEPASEPAAVARKPKGGPVHVCVDPTADDLDWSPTLRAPVVADIQPGDVSAQLMRRHLIWVYGGRPDIDTLADDLTLVKLLSSGMPSDVVASVLDWPKDRVVSRFRELRADMRSSLELQALIIQCLSQFRDAIEREDAQDE